MEDYAYIGELIAGPIYLLVGVRLYQLSMRSGETSDRLLSASFLLWALSYFIYDIGYAFISDGSLLSPFFACGWRLATCIGTIAFTLFTRSVFRGRERWAAWLASGIAVSLLIGLTGSTWLGDWSGANPSSNPWYWLERVGGVAPFVWMGVEGFTQYVKARQRRKLGLCKPAICNRYLLWGLAGAIWMLLEIAFIPQDLAHEDTGQWSVSIGFLVGSLEFVPIGVIWLAFFPPTFYRNWINKLASVAVAAAEADSPHGG